MISSGLRRWLATSLLVAGAGLTGCDDHSAAAPTPPPTSTATTAVTRADLIAQGAALVEQYECNRCHTGLGVADAPRAKACTGCHEDILATEAPKPHEAVWQQNIVHLTFRFDLTSAQRLKPSWIEAHLQRPVDVRPHLGATMPRLRLTADQARAIAIYVTRERGPAPPYRVDERLVAEGRTLVEARGCTACHTMRGADLPRPADTKPKAVALAPDLSLTRDRMDPGTLDRWLADPSAFGSTTMPKPALTEAERRAVVAFLLRAPTRPPAPPPLPPIPTTDTPATYANVEARVLRKVCWHCHAQPDFARGDGGPGMSGGFGYPARKLDLSTYEGVLAGYVGDDGERHSVFRRDDSGEPLLLSVLLRRRHEERGDVTARRGMPLGLPSLPPEDIDLVRRWLEAGHPR